MEPCSAGTFVNCPFFKIKFNTLSFRDNLYRKRSVTYFCFKQERQIMSKQIMIRNTLYSCQNRAEIDYIVRSVTSICFPVLSGSPRIKDYVNSTLHKDHNCLTVDKQPSRNSTNVSISTRGAKLLILSSTFL